jgi:hypothetical protein
MVPGRWIGCTGPIRSSGLTPTNFLLEAHVEDHVYVPHLQIESDDLEHLIWKVNALNEQKSLGRFWEKFLLHLDVVRITTPSPHRQSMKFKRIVNYCIHCYWHNFWRTIFFSKYFFNTVYIIYTHTPWMLSELPSHILREQSMNFKRILSYCNHCYWYNFWRIISFFLNNFLELYTSFINIHHLSHPIVTRMNCPLHCCTYFSHSLCK